MLLGSAVASKEAVRRQFGRENELTIEGPGPPSCRTPPAITAPPPTRGNRLMLAIRYS
jgi:hypothetical protein